MRFTPSRFPLPLMLAVPAFALAACEQPAPTDGSAASETEAPAPEEAAEDLPELIPPQPGEPGGLPDDRTPVSEGPFAPDSAQAAAQVVQQYGAFLEEGRFDDAYVLWGDEGDDSMMTRGQFAHSFDRYTNIHVLVGAPGDPEGAAGSVFVAVPMQMYGRMEGEGTPFNLYGAVTLRRINGPTEDGEPHRWYISDVELAPEGEVREAGAEE